MRPNSTVPPSGLSLAVTIPPGYYELPLSDVEEILSISATLITDSVGDSLKEIVPIVLGTLGFFLRSLAAKNAVYCGIGRHASEEGEPITSWLTISVMDYGEKNNPRLVVQDLAQYKTSQDNAGELVSVDIHGRPILFTERVQRYPAPDLPTVNTDGDDVPVFQAEVLVPSGDGTSIAVVEFSTVSVAQGTRYRAMLLAIADSVEFVESVFKPSSLDL
ncbi:hypothetical protein ACW2Q0_11325 [Nocardia sp. R16R-3T]